MKRDKRKTKGTPRPPRLSPAPASRASRPDRLNNRYWMMRDRQSVEKAIVAKREMIAQIEDDVEELVKRLRQIRQGRVVVR